MAKLSKVVFSLLGMILAMQAQAAEPSITATARQRYPWNGLVDIDCTVTGLENPTLAFMAKDNDSGKFLKIQSLTLDGKAFTNGVSRVTDGSYRLVWDASADLQAEYVATNVSVTVYNGFPAYMSINLAKGSSATSYPVEFFDEIPGGTWSNEYKTTNLVMRLIQPGTYMMQGNRRVTLSKPFYMGVFEVTQKQYQLVTGKTPSYYKGDARPVEYISWNTIMESSGFVTNLINKAGWAFNLPTEAQWEYACRAGTTTTFNNGTSSIAGLGRYNGNTSDGKGGYSSYHTTVGSYTPNAWGLYDMHGNVWEWCLDRYASLGTSAVTDPTGASSGSFRVIRGGSYNYDESSCTSSYRYSSNPSYTGYNYGFRLVCFPGL